MNTTLKQLTEVLRRLSLTREEKEFMHASLLTYMKLRPIRAQQADARVASFSPFFSLRPLVNRAIPVAMVTILVATSVTFAAGDALPGDVLYSVKVNVLERVQVATALGNEAEAKVQAELAAKRLKEAEKLTVRGELNSENKTQIETRFKEHSLKVTNSIKEIEHTDADAAVEVSSAVEASLQTHGNILEKLGESASPETKLDIATLVQEIREVVKHIAAPSEKAEDQIIQSSNEAEAGATVAEKQKKARSSLNEAQDFFAKKRHLFSQKTQEEVASQLDLAEKAIIAGDELLIEKKFVEAYRQFRQAQGMAHEAVIGLEAAIELNLEVSIGPDTETGTSTPPVIEGTGTTTPSNATSTPPSGTGTSTPDQGSGEATSTSGAINIFNTVKNLGR